MPTFFIRFNKHYYVTCIFKKEVYNNEDDFYYYRGTK